MVFPTPYDITELERYRRKRQNEMRPGRQRNQRIRDAGSNFIQSLFDIGNYPGYAQTAVQHTVGLPGTLLGHIIPEVTKVNIYGPEDVVNRPPGGYRTSAARDKRRMRKQSKRQKQLFKREVDDLSEIYKELYGVEDKQARDMAEADLQARHLNLSEEQAVQQAAGLMGNEIVQPADDGPQLPGSGHFFGDPFWTDGEQHGPELPLGAPPGVTEPYDIERANAQAERSSGTQTETQQTTTRNPSEMTTNELFNAVIQEGGMPGAELSQIDRLLNAEEVRGILSGEDNTIFNLGPARHVTREVALQDIRRSLLQELQRLQSQQPQSGDVPLVSVPTSAPNTETSSVPPAELSGYFEPTSGMYNPPSSTRSASDVPTFGSSPGPTPSSWRTDEGQPEDTGDDGPSLRDAFGWWGDFALGRVGPWADSDTGSTPESWRSGTEWIADEVQRMPEEQKEAIYQEYASSWPTYAEQLGSPDEPIPPRDEFITIILEALYEAELYAREQGQ